MSSDAELLRGPTAKRLLSAGVPREEVLANLRATSSPQPHDALPTPQAPSGGPPAILTRQASHLSEDALAPLPEGWEERFDPSTGRHFYVDFVHQTTSWTRPLPSGVSYSVKDLASTNGSVSSTSDFGADIRDATRAAVAYPAISPRDDETDRTASIERATEELSMGMPVPERVASERAPAARRWAPGSARTPTARFFGRPKQRNGGRGGFAKSGCDKNNSEGMMGRRHLQSVFAQGRGVGRAEEPAEHHPPYGICLFCLRCLGGM